LESNVLAFIIRGAFEKILLGWHYFNKLAAGLVSKTVPTIEPFGGFALHRFALEILICFYEFYTQESKLIL